MTDIVGVEFTNEHREARRRPRSVRGAARLRRAYRASVSYPPASLLVGLGSSSASLKQGRSLSRASSSRAPCLTFSA